MRSFALFTLTTLALIGCTDENRSTTVTAPKPQTTGNAGDRETTTVTAAKPQATGDTVDRDNTAVNKRDRDTAAKTPIDQNENKKDIDTTANIRKRVVDTKMSTNAHNVKIITQDGKVTLRGPVKTAEEKRKIEDIARDCLASDGNGLRLRLG